MPDPVEPFLVTRDGTVDLTHAQTLSARFRLTSRGVRLPSEEAAAERARWLAAQLPLRPESVLSHVTAARIHGLPLPWSMQSSSVHHVTTPRDVPRPRRRDIRTHHAQLPASDVCEVGRFRLTTLARTYVDMASVLAFAGQDCLDEGPVLRHPQGLTRTRDRG